MDPRLDPTGSDARFIDLQRRIGLPQSETKPPIRVDETVAFMRR